MTSRKKGKNTSGSRKPGSGLNWTKAAMIIGGIAFVVIMIVSSLGSHWLVGMKPAGDGDVAYCDVTLKDSEGRTVFTTSERIFNAALEQGSMVWLTNPMIIGVNVTTDNLVEPVTAYFPGADQASFAFLGPEYNQVAESLVGMKEGQSKRFAFEQNTAFQREMTSEEFAGIGGNFSEIQVGDQLIFGFTTAPMISAEDNTTPGYALRTVTVTSKTGDIINVIYGYSAADVTILKLSRA
ncbi:MAG TPA: hypothetical protein PLN56_06765 [Methanoregulaceae archaeon]|nr:MAG: hypothetical protein IPI71_07060 [Methanolinea sp.]HON81921.1 hypothetical protein [Methanoregulaceae archaeon]HPD10681.1 hypothetical protein [Methanoregulaceae archaeon]HRT15810.1 hypothetical protein [Methanoregulaceae archaeon]HRU31324.1 hypothetical protein [Methanoregulaceae archaeon]